jgi:hypothetical protein
MPPALRTLDPRLASRLIVRVDPGQPPPAVWRGAFA